MLVSVTPPTPPMRLYQQSEGVYVHKCQECGDAFQTTTRRQAFCSTKCRSDAAGRRRAAKKAAEAREAAAGPQTLEDVCEAQAGTQRRARHPRIDMLA
jgi:endogenous inhibitor of DNA gyrase (YacG/DUF329 family)